MFARKGSLWRAAGAVLLALPVATTIARAVPGDLNDDGRFNANDASAALAASGGLWMPTYSLENGDIAGGSDGTPDGRITVADAVRLLRAYNGLETLPGPVFAAPASDRLTLSADLAKNYQLPRAWSVEGTVKNAAGKPISSDAPRLDIFAEIVFTSESEPSLPWSTPVDMGDGTYAAVVPTGPNSVAIDTEFVEYDEDYNQLYDYWIRQAATPSTLTVSADATQNFVRADLPATGSLSGTVTAPGWTVDTLTLELGNGGASYVTLPYGTQPLPYALKSGPGTGVFYVEGHTEGGDGFSTDLWATLTGSPVTIGAGAAVTRDIVLPGLVTLDGTINSPEDYSWIETYRLLPGGSTVSAYVDADEATGDYELRTPAGDVTVVLGTAGPDDPNGWSELYYVQRLTIPSAGMTKDWTLPAMPTLHAFTGVVTGPDGKPLANAHLYVFPVQTPAEIAPGWTGGGETTTGPDGAFRLLLPTGEYTVQISPPNF